MNTQIDHEKRAKTRRELNLKMVRKQDGSYGVLPAEKANTIAAGCRLGWTLRSFDHRGIMVLLAYEKLPLVGREETKREIWAQVAAFIEAWIGAGRPTVAETRKAIYEKLMADRAETLQRNSKAANDNIQQKLM